VQTRILKRREGKNWCAVISGSGSGSGTFTCGGEMGPRKENGEKMEGGGCGAYALLGC
jgi:hypothetical protein